MLAREGWAVNRKKMQRLWREEGPRVPLKRRKRQRLGTSNTDCERLGAGATGWALDYQFEVTATGRVINILQPSTSPPRESLADLVEHFIDAYATVAYLDRIVAARGQHPEFLPLRQQVPSSPPTPCGTGAASAAPAPLHIEPGSP